jgi:uncharacterized protein (TIGR02145 family)
LTSGTLYHVRAYATNSAGTAYGNDLSFTTVAAVVPTLTTTAVTSVEVTTAVSGGNISSDGGGSITARGTCWATTASPTTGNSKTTNGTGTGSFTSNISGLLAGTTYYVRAYATNIAGTAYGSQYTITTKVQDGDGNTYNTVVIGTQTWMAENLRTTKYNDGTTAISNVTDDATWMGLGTPAYCWYNNSTANRDVYGGMYNWYTIRDGNVCPSGWHVPSDVEWETLELYLGMATGSQTGQVAAWGWRGTDQGAQLKSTSGWPTGQNGTNTSGFTALPGGYRYAANGTFNNIGTLSYWWTSTAEPLPSDIATYRRMDGAADATNNQVFRGAVNQEGGKYIRCLKD